MRALHLAFLAVVLATSHPARAGNEDSLRCPGGLVAVGDPRIDLLGRCGEPTLREVAQSVEVGVVRQATSPPDAATRGALTTRRETSAVERWTYDFGRNQFIRIVTLEGGRVRAIETGGRGYTEATARERRPLPVATCDYKGLRVGDPAYEVLARCGEPATRDVRLLERTFDVPGGAEDVQRTVTVPIEVWAYHFGPQILTRIVELEDGKIVRVDTASHGYSP